VTTYKYTESLRVKLELFSADGIVKTREYVVREVFAVIEICKILDEVIQRHFLSHVLQTHRVTLCLSNYYFHTGITTILHHQRTTTDNTLVAWLFHVIL